jgi:hypothetical protein
MHPFEISRMLRKHGFWYTYWEQRTLVNMRRAPALWVIWMSFWLTRPMRCTLDAMF